MIPFAITALCTLLVFLNIMFLVLLHFYCSSNQLLDDTTHFFCPINYFYSSLQLSFIKSKFSNFNFVSLYPHTTYFTRISYVLLWLKTKLTALIDNVVHGLNRLISIGNDKKYRLDLFQSISGLHIIESYKWNKQTLIFMPEIHYVKFLKPGVNIWWNQ